MLPQDVGSKKGSLWWETVGTAPFYPCTAGGNPEAPELTNELEKLQEMLQSASLELLDWWDDAG